MEVPRLGVLVTQENAEVESIASLKCTIREFAHRGVFNAACGKKSGIIENACPGFDERPNLRYAVLCEFDLLAGNSELILVSGGFRVLHEFLIAGQGPLWWKVVEQSAHLPTR